MLMFLFVSHAFAQVILTYRNNTPLPGDTILTYSIEPFSPGNEGPDQVWDFSKIQLNGEKNVSFISTKPTRSINGLTNFDFTFTEKGYEYFYKNDEINSTVVGLTIKDLSVVFTDPVLKMKYPVLYGTNFTDEFAGTGSDKLSTDIGLSGSYSLKADAFGTVIFHDRTIKDVLRLKISENKIQINQCGLYESVITTYLWYAPAARYPVMALTTRQMSINGKAPVATTTAYVNPKMSNSGILLAGTDQNTIGNDEVALVLFPNPFVSKLNFNYFLRKQMPVTLELVDMTGKTILSIYNEEIQSEGFHSGELDAAEHNLKMGVYNFRFKFGEKEMVSKVVKM
jgi:hypothetical protein